MLRDWIILFCCCGSYCSYYHIWFYRNWLTSTFIKKKIFYEWLNWLLNWNCEIELFTEIRLKTEETSLCSITHLDEKMLELGWTLIKQEHFNGTIEHNRQGSVACYRLIRKQTRSCSDKCAVDCCVQPNKTTTNNEDVHSC